MGAQQLDPLHRFDQLAILIGEPLGGLEAEGGTTALLHRGQLWQVGGIGDCVFLHGPQQERTSLRSVDRLHELHRLRHQPGGDLLTGVHHASIAAVAAEHLGVADLSQIAGANDDFPEDVVLLGHCHDAGSLAEDVLHHLRAGFDPLAVLNHQQGDVFVDLMGFLRDPEKSATLAHLVAMLGGAGFLDRQAGGEFHDAAGLGPEAVVVEFGNHLTGTDLGTGMGDQPIATAILLFEEPVLAAVGGFTLQFAVLEVDAGGDDLHLA